MNKNLLYIGLNGLAGSGKDTVAKMLKTILSKNWNSLEECKEYYFSTYINPTQSATFPPTHNETNIMCIAYADQLKTICSSIFGIPIERFYKDKSNAWICINDKFQYTEVKPNDNNIITAEEYYYEYNMGENVNKAQLLWMSLREILVYVGTYVLQQSINKEIFINIVRNKIKDTCYHNDEIQYIIITDHRFSHELEYIYENNGITISITRNGVKQLNNIAEHDLDDEIDYDYIIDNSNSYDDLIKYIWDIVHENIEFKNITIDLYTRDDTHNYLRLIDKNESTCTYRLCLQYKIKSLYKDEGKIKMIDPVGGPSICVGEAIDGTNIIPIDIILDNNKILIITNNT